MADLQLITGDQIRYIFTIQCRTLKYAVHKTCQLELNTFVSGVYCHEKLKLSIMGQSQSDLIPAT